MFIVYRVTNNVNGRYYIGVHKTDDLNDGYMGSGILIQRALKKHGKENFTREILASFDDADSAYLEEKRLVDEALVRDGRSYNLREGGYGGRMCEDSRRKVSQSLTGRKRPDISGENNPSKREDIRQKISETKRGKKFSEEHKQKISEANKGNVGYWVGKTRSDDTKRKISEANKGRKFPEVTCPHCKKTGAIAPMTNWHFDKCKCRDVS